MPTLIDKKIVSNTTSSPSTDNNNPSSSSSDTATDQKETTVKNVTTDYDGNVSKRYASAAKYTLEYNKNQRTSSLSTSSLVAAPTCNSNSRSSANPSATLPTAAQRQQQQQQQEQQNSDIRERYESAARYNNIITQQQQQQFPQQHSNRALLLQQNKIFVDNMTGDKNNVGGREGGASDNPYAAAAAATLPPAAAVVLGSSNSEETTTTAATTNNDEESSANAISTSSSSSSSSLVDKEKDEADNKAALASTSGTHAKISTEEEEDEIQRRKKQEVDIVAATEAALVSATNFKKLIEKQEKVEAALASTFGIKLPTKEKEVAAAAVAASEEKTTLKWPTNLSYHACFPSYSEDEKEEDYNDKVDNEDDDDDAVSIDVIVSSPHLKGQSSFEVIAPVVHDALIQKKKRSFEEEKDRLMKEEEEEKDRLDRLMKEFEVIAPVVHTSLIQKNKRPFDDDDDNDEDRLVEEMKVKQKYSTSHPPIYFLNLCRSGHCTNKAQQGGLCLRHGGKRKHRKRKKCDVEGRTSRAVSDQKCKTHAHGTNELKATNEPIEDLTLEGKEKDPNDKSPPASKLKLSRSPPICHSKSLTASKKLTAFPPPPPPPPIYTGACVPLHPTPLHFQGDMDLFKDKLAPEFSSLLNFPCYMARLETVDPTRNCVMCGLERERKKRQKSMKGHPPTIPNQNKGLCTDCDVKVWVHRTGAQIKWCKGCKNFRMWATFGARGEKSKCLPCRERQSEMYRKKKEAEEEKSKRQKKQEQIAMMNVKDMEKVDEELEVIHRPVSRASEGEVQEGEGGSGREVQEAEADSNKPESLHWTWRRFMKN